MQLVCPLHQKVLEFEPDKGMYVCSLEYRHPIMRNIPRFVPGDNYASAIGPQWKTYRKTQLDSYTGVSISRDRLERLLGGDLHILKGKQVLETVCGVGHFTEVLRQRDAEIQALDLFPGGRVHQ